VATTAQRAHVVHVLDYFHAHAGQLLYPPGDRRLALDNECWHWSEQTLHHVLDGGGKWEGDCSEFVPYVLKCAGLWHWSQPGATASHLQLLPVYTDAREAYAGAPVIFGPGGGHHEAIVHTPDHEHGNPLLSSHGRPGFDAVHLRDLQAEQTRSGHPGVRLLSIEHL
jgi:hypothetical protein